MKNHAVLNVRDRVATHGLAATLAFFAVLIAALTAISNPGGLEIAVCTYRKCLCAAMPYPTATSPADGQKALTEIHEALACSLRKRESHFVRFFFLLAILQKGYII